MSRGNRIARRHERRSRLTPPHFPRAPWNGCAPHSRQLEQLAVRAWEARLSPRKTWSKASWAVAGMYLPTSPLDVLPRQTSWTFDSAPGSACSLSYARSNRFGASPPVLGSVCPTHEISRRLTRRPLPLRSWGPNLAAPLLLLTTACPLRLDPINVYAFFQAPQALVAPDAARG